MKFKKQETLKIDQNPNGYYEVEVDGVLFVGEKSIFSWESDNNECGCQFNTLQPGFLNGDKIWLHSWIWYGHAPYIANGEGEKILKFEEGVNFLLEKGCYNYLFVRE